LTTEINKCIEILKNGGIILYPTDTVWGIGCDATNAVAVDKIFQLKQRTASKSLIVLVANEGMLQNHVVDVPELAWDIIDIATSPTTIIYPKGKNLAKNVLAQDGSIAIRLIKDNFCTQLLQKFRKPIVSTSANMSETPTPLSFSSISTALKDSVDYVVNPQFDNGTHKPSALLKIGMGGEIEVIRK